MASQFYDLSPQPLLPGFEENPTTRNFINEFLIAVKSNDLNFIRQFFRLQEQYKTPRGLRTFIQENLGYIVSETIHTFRSNHFDKEVLAQAFGYLFEIAFGYTGLSKRNNLNKVLDLLTEISEGGAILFKESIILIRSNQYLKSLILLELEELLSGSLIPSYRQVFSTLHQLIDNPIVDFAAIEGDSYSPIPELMSDEEYQKLNLQEHNIGIDEALMLVVRSVNSKFLERLGKTKREIISDGAAILTLTTITSLIVILIILQIISERSGL